MAYNIILSQGRIADRTAGAIPGAALTATLVEKLTSAPVTTIGSRSPVVTDDWSVSLPQARDTLNGISDALDATLKNNQIPVLVANTCSASLASLPVVARERPDSVLLWIDAHGDFNTPETTGSGYLGGMVVAAASGLWDSGHGAGLRSEQVIIIGGRDIDEEEAAMLAKAGVRIIAPAQTTPETVLQAIGDTPIWVHVDWDVMEPDFIPAAYKVADGLMPQQLRDLFAALPKDKIAGIELAEFEAGDDAAANNTALAVLEEIITPLFK